LRQEKKPFGKIQENEFDDDGLSIFFTPARALYLKYHHVVRVREMPTVVRAAKCRWLEDGDKKNVCWYRFRARVRNISFFSLNRLTTS